MSKRANRLVGQIGLSPVADEQKEKKEDQSVTVVDNRTGKKYTIPIKNNTIDASAFFAKDSPKLRLYDPGCMNTASATSRITYISGGKGILRYRGYPIEQLAEKSTFLEVAYLLIYGQLPDASQSKFWHHRIMRHTLVHEDMKKLMESFRYDAHPMGMFISAIAAMSTFHPEANPALAGQDVYKNLSMRNKQIHRIIGTVPTLAAFAYRNRMGRPFVDASAPEYNLTYAENFLYMLDKMPHVEYKPHPVLARALDILFILHADHELNCSTAAMRHLVSSGVDVYSAISGSAVALYGPKHGGANEAVLRMLEKIGSVENVPKFVEQVKAKSALLMGFGHRVYKNYDPRAKIVRQIANDVFNVLGKEPLIEVATALEQVALKDPYFIDRKLYPNVDFYSGLIYKAMGFPMDYFTVLFALPRTVGWLAHWSEFLDDPENRIIRPRQVYVGAGERDFVPMESRPKGDKGLQGLESYHSAESRRRHAATKIAAKV